MRVWKLIKLAKKYWGFIAITAVALVINAGMQLVSPAVVQQMTGAMTSGELTVRLLVIYSAVLIGSYLIKALSRFISIWVGHIAAWRFVGELTSKVYDKLQALSMRYYQDKQTGQLMSRMVNDTRLLELLVAHALPDLFCNLVLLCGVIAMIFTINPVLALFALIPVPFVLFVSLYFNQKVSSLFRINQRVFGDLNGDLQDNLSGMKEIQAFGREKREHLRMADACAGYSRVNIRANFANAIFNPSVEFLTSMGTVVVVAAGGILFLQGQMPVSEIVGFIMYLSLFYQPLSALARLIEDVQNACAGGERVVEVLETEPDIKDRPGAVAMGRAKGEVEFCKVDFAYRDNEPILNQVSFHAKPGEMVAIVGATGVGKTTIVSLLERFYEPTGGKILLDKMDIGGLTIESLRSNLSMVLQDVFLFNGTIYENIAYGVESASEQAVYEAARIACCDEFIREMPDGYDTMIGERGTRLSGGQKQRIAIARAVLRNTPVLILDEATSAVDTETEAKIQVAIENLTGKHTMIVIAHRLSTIMRADHIIVLDKGTIVQEGTHEQLLAEDGIYAKLCNIQSDKIRI